MEFRILGSMAGPRRGSTSRPAGRRAGARCSRGGWHVPPIGDTAFHGKGVAPTGLTRVARWKTI